MFLSQFCLTQVQRIGCLVALALPLGLASCEQPQAVPVPKVPTTQMRPDQYYLNATASTKEVVERLDSKTITNVEVLKGQQAADYAHDAAVNGVVLVHTR